MATCKGEAPSAQFVQTASRLWLSSICRCTNACQAQHGLARATRSSTFHVQQPTLRAVIESPSAHEARRAEPASLPRLLLRVPPILRPQATPRRAAPLCCQPELDLKVAYDRSPRLAISISAFAQSMACDTTHALLDQSLSTHEAYGGTPHRPDKIGRGYPTGSESPQWLAGIYDVISTTTMVGRDKDVIYRCSELDPYTE